MKSSNQLDSMDAPPLAAVVLAGAAGNDPLAQHFGIASKALLPLCDKPLVWQVLDALHQSTRVGTVIYVGPEHPQLLGSYHKRLEPKPDIIDNIRAAFAELPPGPLLLVSSDLPWLRASHVDAFVEQTQTAPASLLYPVIPAKTVLEQFPDQGHREFANIRYKPGSERNEMTGGSIFLVREAARVPLLNFAAQAHQARKSLWKLAQLLGWRLSIQFVTGQLSIPQVEARVSQLLGVQAAGLHSQCAALAIDVDTLEEYHLALNNLES